MPKWLGFKLGDVFYAIALESVLRVYHHHAADGVSIEAQEGYPVFIVPASQVFADQNTDLTDIEPATASWVVVLKSHEASKIGFRVERTFGPFLAKEDEHQTIVHENMTLRVVRPIGGTHG